MNTVIEREKERQKAVLRNLIGTDVKWGASVVRFFDNGAGGPVDYTVSVSSSAA